MGVARQRLRGGRLDIVHELLIEFGRRIELLGSGLNGVGGEIEINRRGIVTLPGGQQEAPVVRSLFLETRAAGRPGEVHQRILTSFPAAFLGQVADGLRQFLPAHVTERGKITQGLFGIGVPLFVAMTLCPEALHQQVGQISCLLEQIVPVERHFRTTGNGLTSRDAGQACRPLPGLLLAILCDTRPGRDR